MHTTSNTIVAATIAKPVVFHQSPHLRCCMGYIFRNLSFLLLLFSSVQGDCVRGGLCNDADKMLADIAADSKSYQQLLQAIYNTNKAQPAYIVVAYFMNFTAPFQRSVMDTPTHRSSSPTLTPHTSGGFFGPLYQPMILSTFSS